MGFYGTVAGHEGPDTPILRLFYHLPQGGVFMATESIEHAAPLSMPLSQWFAVAGAFLVVAVPWWLGLLWIIGVIT